MCTVFLVSKPKQKQKELMGLGRFVASVRESVIWVVRGLILVKQSCRYVVN